MPVLVIKPHATMARPVRVLILALRPADPTAGFALLDRLHDWLTEHTSAAAAAVMPAAGIVRAAFELTRPTRLTRAKQAIRRAVCGADDFLHVEAATDVQQECARIIDGAGGLGFSAPTSLELPSWLDKRGHRHRLAVPKRPHALLLHGIRVGDVLTGRHALWQSQRAAGTLRPVPLARALEVVAAHVDVSCMLPEAHACESPAMLRAARRPGLAAFDGDEGDAVGCRLCWRNANLRTELGPGHVRATIPALYAAGYDAGHLLLRHAEHALARAASDMVRERRVTEPPRKRARHDDGPTPRAAATAGAGDQTSDWAAEAATSAPAGTET